LSQQNSTELDVVDLPEKSTNKAGFSSTTREQQSVNSSRSVRKTKSSKQTIRAFLKKSFASFRSNDSSDESLYGYDDPIYLLLSERECE
jgi:hypothetical protein